MKTCSEHTSGVEIMEKGKRKKNIKIKNLFKISNNDIRTKSLGCLYDKLKHLNKKRKQ